MNLESFIRSINFKLLIIPILFTIHELEEWNILRWYKKHYINLPNSTNLSIRIWIILISAIIFILTIVSLIFINKSLIFSPLIILISAFIFLNIVQHIIWTIQYKDYSIGLSTAILCLLFLIYVHSEMIINGLLNPWFYLIIIYTLIPIIKTIKSPHVMTDEIRKVHELGISLEKRYLSIKNSKTHS